MSLCINPDCPQPTHPGNSHSVTCQACQSSLLLQDRYRVMRLISNKTGFGTVYEAYERDEPKILKVLRRDRAQHPKVLHLFQQEAQVLSQIQHSGVPFIAQDGYFTYSPQNSDESLHCIVMEKIDGPNLQQWMQQQGNHPISEHQAFQWLQQLTDILRRVHQHNYFHRDIKPDNVMLRSNGQLVLVDFGAAREMTQTYLAQIGSLGVTTVSSAGYTPPEQEQGQAVPQSDFFALGRTIIYLLTGLSPNDTTLYDPMLNTFNWRTRAPQISEEFAQLLSSLIAPRVVDRPKTAQEILDRLWQLAVARQELAPAGQTLFPETAMPGDNGPIPIPHGGFPGAATQQDGSTWLQKQPPRITGWTWLIAGGVTLGALVIVGIGWGRYRLQPSPATEALTTEEAAPAETPTPPESVLTQAVSLVQEFSGHSNSINALKILSGKQQLLSASADTTLQLRNLATGEIVQTYEGHSTFVDAIAISPDGKVLYSSSANGSIFQWNLETGEKQGEFLGHTSAVRTLDRTPDSRLLVSGAADGTIVLWDLQTQTPVATIKGHDGPINALVVTRDGQRIISGGADQVVQVWDIASGERLHRLEGHEGFVNAIAESPNGQIILSASADETIRRWDPNTGELLGTLTDHDSYVNVLTFSPDGRTFSSGSADGVVRVWDIKTGEPIRVYTGFDMPIDHLAQSSSGQLITATKTDSVIKSWVAAP